MSDEVRTSLADAGGTVAGPRRSAWSPPREGRARRCALGCGPVVTSGELGPDVVGAWMVELGEDVEGLLPGPAGGGAVAHVVLGVADMVERLRFAERVAEFPVQVERLLVADNGVGLLAEVVVDVAEAVPGVCLTDPVVELLQQGEGLCAVDQGLFVVAEQGEVPADCVVGLGLPELVAGVAVQVEGPVVVV